MANAKSRSGSRKEDRRRRRVTAQTTTSGKGAHDCRAESGGDPQDVLASRTRAALPNLRDRSGDLADRFQRGMDRCHVPFKGHRSPSTEYQRSVIVHRSDVILFVEATAGGIAGTCASNEACQLRATGMDQQVSVRMQADGLLRRRDRTSRRAVLEDPSAPRTPPTGLRHPHAPHRRGERDEEPRPDQASTRKTGGILPHAQHRRSGTAQSDGFGARPALIVTLRRDRSRRLSGTDEE